MAESLKFRFFAAGKYQFYGFVERDRFVGIPQLSERLDLAEVMRRTERFSGFQDCDGKDIWEGDVIQDVASRSRKYVVVYDEAKARWGRSSLVTEGTVLFPLFINEADRVGYSNLGPRRLVNIYR